MMRGAIKVLTSGGGSCWWPEGRDALVSAIEVLRDLDMPPDEVDAVVATDQPVIVHRYMELHRERLEERLADQVRTLERVKRILSPAISEADSRPPAKRPSSEGARSLRGPAVAPGIRGPMMTKAKAGTQDRRLYVLIYLAALMALGHHMDHVIRGNHVGWPLNEEVNAFTYSLAIYPGLLIGLYLYRSHRVGPSFWVLLSAGGALFVGFIHFGPAAVEPPPDIIDHYEPRFLGWLAYGWLVAFIRVLVLASVYEATLASRHRPAERGSPVARRTDRAARLGPTNEPSESPSGRGWRSRRSRSWERPWLAPPVWDPSATEQTPSEPRGGRSIGRRYVRPDG